MGCRGCGVVSQIDERAAAAVPGRCTDCGRRLEAMSAEESRQLVQRRLARQRVQRLSRAAVAQQLRSARSQPSRRGPAL